MGCIYNMWQLGFADINNNNWLTWYTIFDWQPCYMPMLYDRHLTWHMIWQIYFVTPYYVLSIIVTLVTLVTYWLMLYAILSLISVLYCFTCTTFHQTYSWYFLFSLFYRNIIACSHRICTCTFSHFTHSLGVLTP